MMLHQFIPFLLVASGTVDQCHSFKHVKRRPALSTVVKANLRLIDHCHPRHRHCPRYLHSTKPLFSIRGGNDEYGEEDEYDDDITYEFISSFESELAEIRREAEIEAENEMQQLRGLIERRGKVEEEIETDSEYNEDIDESNENGEPVTGAPDDKSSDNDVIEEEETNDDQTDEAPAEAIIQSEIESDMEDGRKEEISSAENEQDTLQNDESDVIDLSEIESDVEDGSKEEIGSAENEEDESQLSADLEEVNDDSVEPSSGIIGSGAAAVPVTDSTVDNCDSADGEAEIKPRKSKTKKGKSSKKGKGKKKVSRINMLEESGLSDMGTEELGESVMLTSSHDEVMQTPQSGIMFYLRSDLGRALCLFIATVILALMTTRLQRQMEAEGI